MRRDARWLKRAELILLCGWIPLGANAATQDDYAYRHALTTTGHSAAWRVELTPAIYAQSRPEAHLRDLIVVNGQGEPVPFAPLPASPLRVHPFALTAGLLPLPANATDGSGAERVQRSRNGDIVIEQPPAALSSIRPTQWLLDAHRQVRLARIDIDPAALPDDARFHLSVEASNDLQSWSSLGGRTEIVSVRRGADAVVQRSIRVRATVASRYYRLNLREGDIAPWASAQTPLVELHGTYTDPLADRAASRQWLSADAATISSAAGGTHYDYTLPAALPVEAVRIDLAGANTAARFRLLDRDDSRQRTLATITAVQIGDSGDDTAPTTFAASRVQHLRLHTDTPLAQPPTLRVGWQPDVFVFLAEGNGPYSLLVGSYAAQRGNYPLAAALARIRPRDASVAWQPPLATLGAVSDAAGPAALLAPKLPFDWTRLLLWLVLIGGALAVTAMAWSLLRQPHRPGSER
ncbi:MAG TPA: DUF3999 family protein [Rhodanobacter sp.]